MTDMVVCCECPNSQSVTDYESKTLLGLTKRKSGGQRAES
jgi:hypothetical protein